MRSIPSTFFLLFKQKRVVSSSAAVAAGVEEDIWCRRVHYCNFTHRSWFPLTRNRSYIKNEAKCRWKIIINDGKTIIAMAAKWERCVCRKKMR